MLGARQRLASTRLLAIGTGDGPPELDRAVALAARYPQVFATVGVHPHDAAKADAKSFQDLRALAQEPKVVAIGEIGLDYHYDFSPPKAQREVFLEQLRIAREAGKPVIIHTREAWEETVALLREHWKRRARHYCTVSPERQSRRGKPWRSASIWVSAAC